MSPEEFKKFLKQNDESEILDFKENLDSAKQIGEYVSALGNSAIIIGKPAAYLVWGIEDLSKKVVGTKFNPYTAKANKETKMPLIKYVETYLSPRLDLNWEKLSIENKTIIILTIDVRHITQPISFLGKRYIRVGTSKTALNEHPEKERRLWQSFESIKFELDPIKYNLSFEELNYFLDLSYYAKKRNLSFEYPEQIIDDLIKNNIITENSVNSYNITNLGAYTLAKDLSNFPALEKRSIRIVKYNGKSNLNASFDKRGNLGIAVSFDNIILNIMHHIPYVENYQSGSREDIPMFPLIAIRELVANALVHQDFTITGSRPMVEIFDNRIEISNPGTPLIEPNRFLDFKPKSRNDELANVLGKLNIVESRGTGIDKVVTSLENLELPSMDIKIQGSESTVVILRAKKDFNDMSATEKIQSIYWHACLKYVEDEQISNATLRERFGLSKSHSALISKAINLSIDAGYIKPYDPNAGKKHIKYIPYWGVDVFNR